MDKTVTVLKPELGILEETQHYYGVMAVWSLNLLCEAHPNHSMYVSDLPIFEPSSKLEFAMVQSN
jgi:hypothetical protein